MGRGDGDPRRDGGARYRPPGRKTDAEIFGLSADHADTLTGNAGANVLHGRRGADVPNGGAGIDLLDWGLGEDTLIIALCDGQNFMEHFKSGSDITVLEGLPTGAAVYGRLCYVSQQGDDLVAEPFGNSVTLANTALAELALEGAILF